MALLPLIERWITERPPDFVFEVNESGLAYASPAAAGAPVSEAVPPASLVPSPSSQNVLNPEGFRAALTRIAPNGSVRKPTAALVLPDYAVRMAILDFDQWPDDEAQRMSLVRFRLRKSVPFAIEEAQVSYSIQGRPAAATGGSGQTEILAVAMDQRILKEYESIFTDFGFRVGLVMPSGVACLSLFPDVDSVAGSAPLSLLLKLSGAILTVLLLEGDAIRLVRCVDFTEPAAVDPEAEERAPARPFSAVDDTLPVLTQTLAYAEDEIGHRVDRLILSGFGEATSEVGSVAESEFQLPWDVLHSRFAPAQTYAGLLGLLERYAA